MLPLMRTFILSAFLVFSPLALAQTSVPSASSTTSTDLFVMPGSDFDRPGLVPRSNLNIGMGHTVDRLTKYKIGNEPTFAYTYENAGSHGFWHTQYGSHTETVGLMKTFGLPQGYGLYLWVQEGITSLTGYSKVKNRQYQGDSIGLMIPVGHNQSIWIQESYNKVETFSWYTSTNVGYVISW